MSLKKLYEVFRGHEQLPIEIEEIAQAICNLGFQDRIEFHSVSMDTRELCGVIYQYTDQAVVYGEPRLVTLIAFPNDVSIPDSRVICCKELLHVIDRAGERVNSATRLDHVTVDLLGEKDEAASAEAFIAAQDRLTIYRCLPLLFPAAARAAAVEMFKNGERTVDQIAEWASLPRELVAFILGDDWPDVEKTIINGC